MKGFSNVLAFSMCERWRSRSHRLFANASTTRLHEVCDDIDLRGFIAEKMMIFFWKKKWKEIRYESITIMHVYHTRVMQHENYEKNSKKMIAWIAVARYWAKAKDLVVAKPCEMELHAGFPYPPEATLWNVVTQDKTTRNSERNGQFSGHEKNMRSDLEQKHWSTGQPPRAAFASASSSLSLTHSWFVNCNERTLALMYAAMVF